MEGGELRDDGFKNDHFVVTSFASVPLLMFDDEKCILNSLFNLGGGGGGTYTVMLARK